MKFIDNIVYTFTFLLSAYIVKIAEKKTTYNKRTKEEDLNGNVFI